MLLDVVVVEGMMMMMDTQRAEGSIGEIQIGLASDVGNGQSWKAISGSETMFHRSASVQAR